MFGHRDHVASDAKITNFQSFNPVTLPADVICGPVGSNDNPESTPTFRWSTSAFEPYVAHLGHPMLLNSSGLISSLQSRRCSNGDFTAAATLEVSGSVVALQFVRI